MKSAKVVIREASISYNFALRFLPRLFTIASPIKKKQSINAQPTRNWRSPTSAKQKGIIIILQHICVREKKNK